MPPIRHIRLIKNTNREPHYSYYLHPSETVNFVTRARHSPTLAAGVGLQTLSLSGNELTGDRHCGLDVDTGEHSGDIADPYLLDQPLLSGGLDTETRGKWNPALHNNNNNAQRFNAPLPPSGGQLLAVTSRVANNHPAFFVTLGPTSGFPRLVLPPGAAPQPEPSTLITGTPSDPTAPPRPPDLWKPGDPYDGHLVTWTTANGDQVQCPVGFVPRFADPLNATAGGWIGCSKSYGAA